MKRVLQALHRALRPFAWSSLCPELLLRWWCYLGDLAYRGRIEWVR